VAEEILGCKGCPLCGSGHCYEIKPPWECTQYIKERMLAHSFITDRTRQFTNKMFLASDSFRIDNKPTDDVFQSVVVYRFHNARRLQISQRIGSKFGKSIFFSGTWL